VMCLLFMPATIIPAAIVTIVRLGLLITTRCRGDELCEQSRGHRVDALLKHPL
jgi:hypothetical protein